MPGFLLGTYRPPLPNGYPGIDFRVGRTSTSFLNVAYPDVSGTSSTTIDNTNTQGTDVTLTTQAGVTRWPAGQNVFVTASSTGGSVSIIYMYGVVKSYSGTTLVVTVSSIGPTHGSNSSWYIFNWPSGWQWIPGDLGSPSGNMNVFAGATDWDFTNLPGYYNIGGANAGISQCIFSLATTTISNQAFITSLGGGYYSLQNCTFDGAFSSANVTALTNSAAILIEYCWVQNWPQDVFDIAPMSLRVNNTVVSLSYGMRVDNAPHLDFICTTAGTTAGSEPAAYTGAVNGQQITDGTAVFTAQNTKHYVRNNLVYVTGLGPLHPDFSQIQLTSWSSGADLEIYNNVGQAVPVSNGGAFSMEGFFYGGNGANIGVNISVHDNVIVAGTNDVQANWGGQGATITGSANFRNLYVNIDNGDKPFNSDQASGKNLTINGVYNYKNGNPVTFDIKQEISIESKTIGTGSFVFSSIIPGVKTSQWTNGAVISLFTNNDGSSFLASINGTVTSFTGGALTMNATSFTGSGTFTSWVEKLTNLTVYP